MISGRNGADLRGNGQLGKAVVGRVVMSEACRSKVSRSASHG